MTTGIEQQAARVAEQGGSIVAVSGGLWSWLGQNNEAIAAACALAGAVVAVTGLIMHWHYLRLQHQRR